MNSIAEITVQRGPKRIGILLADLGKLNTSVLKYLVLHINTLQKSFEFELLPELDPQADDFLKKLPNQATVRKGKLEATVNRNEIKEALPEFLDRYRAFLGKKMDGLMDNEVPHSLIVITLARFDNYYYSARGRDISILALGRWDDLMAPPSIVEFILTLVIREAVGFICPSLRGSVHLGTKGCVCDFTPLLIDARLKVLNGFICSYCRSKLEAQDLSQ